MNAQAEFLHHIMNAPNVKAVTIMYDKVGTGFDDINNIKVFNLYEGFTDEDFTKFIEDLDFDYDHSYGTQHLFGTIWYEDGAWSERYEYDGSECWDYKFNSGIWHYDMQDFIDRFNKHKEQMDAYYAREERRMMEENGLFDDPNV